MAKLLAALYKKPNLNLDTLMTGAPDLDSRNVALILVPTTAGSGAEATHFSVLYRDGVKHSVAEKALLPDHTVLDPHLVTGGSSHLLAASGLDSICQFIVSLWAKGSTIESRKMAPEGLRVVSANLVQFANGDNDSAKAMQWGSHLSGHAINTSKTTAPHALSYFLTTRLGVPHGIAVASTLGYFIDHHTRTAASSHSSHVVFSEATKAIRVGLGLRENDRAIEYFRTLFAEIGLNEPEDYWPQDPALRDEWMNSANPERLGNHPEPLESKDLYEILRLDS
jgi:alcohol dehydrogenase class IV